MRTLTVALAERSYPIHIGGGALRSAGVLLAPLTAGRRVIIVSNPVVAAKWLAPLRESLAAAGIAAETILVADGETHKTWATAHDVLTRLLELRAERSTTLVALGGGVVGDIAGFAAAIYQRGMSFVQIPTTLLAQVDSSIGGKTGVNHPLGKNMIGAFHQPQAVLIDPECLRTLPARELVAGLAEVIKYGAIRDRAFFDWLEAQPGAAAWTRRRRADARHRRVLPDQGGHRRRRRARSRRAGAPQLRPHVRTRDRSRRRLRRVAPRRGGRRGDGDRRAAVGAARPAAAIRFDAPACSTAAGGPPGRCAAAGRLAISRV